MTLKVQEPLFVLFAVRGFREMRKISSSVTFSPIFTFLCLAHINIIRHSTRKREFPSRRGHVLRVEITAALVVDEVEDVGLCGVELAGVHLCERVVALWRFLLLVQPLLKKKRSVLVD